MPYGYEGGPGGTGKGNRGGRDRGYGYGRGWGWGYGPGWGFGGPGPWWYAPFVSPWSGWGAPTPEEERDMLLDYKAYLEDELRMVDERLKEIEEELGGE